MFLSQPPMATSPSKPSPPATVSMESAMTSRETSEYFMPSVPIEMPSDTVIVLKMTAFPPAASAPAAASRARFVDVDVARRDLAPRGGDADLRTGKILTLEADGVEHGAARGAVGAVEHRTGNARWAEEGSRTGHGNEKRVVRKAYADLRGFWRKKEEKTKRVARLPKEKREHLWNARIRFSEYFSAPEKRTPG